MPCQSRLVRTDQSLWEGFSVIKYGCFSVNPFDRTAWSHIKSPLCVWAIWGRFHCLCGGKVGAPVSEQNMDILFKKPLHRIFSRVLISLAILFKMMRLSSKVRCKFAFVFLSDISGTRFSLRQSQIC